MLKKGVLGEKRGKTSEIAGKWCFFGVSEAKETQTNKNKTLRTKTKALKQLRQPQQDVLEQQQQINNNQQRSTTKQKRNEEQINNNISKTETKTTNKQQQENTSTRTTNHRGKASEIAGTWCFWGVSEAKETQTSKNKTLRTKTKALKQPRQPQKDVLEQQQSRTIKHKTNRK